jgi:hypothetical protein
VLWIRIGIKAGQDPDPALLAKPRYGSESRILIAKNGKILQLKKFLFLNKKKIAVYLSLGLYEGRQSYREVFSPQQRTSSSSNMKFLHFFLFCGSYLLSWILLRMSITNTDVDLDPADQNQCESMRIRTHYAF